MRCWIRPQSPPTASLIRDAKGEDEHPKKSHMVTACHVCKFNGKGDPRCITCKRVNQDDIRIERAPHLGDNSERVSARPITCRGDETEWTDKATKAKCLVYTWTELSPIELVVALHLARRGSFRTAGLAAADFIRSIRSYKIDSVFTDGKRRKNLDVKQFAIDRASIGMKWGIVKGRFAFLGDSVGSIRGNGCVDFKLDAFREAVRLYLSEADSNAAVFQLMIRTGYRASKVGDILGNYCKQGGRAEEDLARLNSFGADAEDDGCVAFCKRIVRKFSAFADILDECLPRSGVWVNDGERHAPAKTGFFHAFIQRELLPGGRFVPIYSRGGLSTAKLRDIISPNIAAKRLGINRELLRCYRRKGHIVGIYNAGKLIGYSHESVKRYAAIRNGLRFTADGSPYQGDIVSLADACRIIGRGEVRVLEFAEAGRIERVFRSESGRCACGYTRESVEKLARELIAGVYYTATAKLVGVEIVHRDEMCKLLHKNSTAIVELADANEIVRVYSDAELVHAVGFTRESVIAYAQAHPPRMHAKAAKAVDDFMIEVITPPAHPPRMRAERLAADEPPRPPAASRPTPKRDRPRIIFRLKTTSDKGGTNTMESEPNTTPTAISKTDKLEVAKAFTIHEGGVIRAICVSEEDRDEIAAALKFYRKNKQHEAEIESALALMSKAKELVGIIPDGGKVHE